MLGGAHRPRSDRRQLPALVRLPVDLPARARCRRRGRGLGIGVSAEDAQLSLTSAAAPRPRTPSPTGPRPRTGRPGPRPEAERDRIPAATREQQAAIDARSADVFCEAGAGSGKTRVLVGRYCDALDRGRRLDRPDPRLHLHRAGGGRAARADPARAGPPLPGSREEGRRCPGGRAAGLGAGDRACLGDDDPRLLPPAARRAPGGGRPRPPFPRPRRARGGAPARAGRPRVARRADLRRRRGRRPRPPRRTALDRFAAHGARRARAPASQGMVEPRLPERRRSGPLAATARAKKAEEARAGADRGRPRRPPPGRPSNCCSSEPTRATAS